MHGFTRYIGFCGAAVAASALFAAAASAPAAASPVSASLAAASPANPATASLATAGTVSAAWCGPGTLAMAAPMRTAPRLTHAGDYGSVPVTVRNTGHTATSGTTLTLAVADSRGRKGTEAPALRWRLDDGAWHSASLRHDTLGAGFYGYRSDAMDLPRIAAGSTHTLHLATAFRKGSADGFYTVQATLRAARCAGYLGYVQASYVFAPAPAKPSPSPTPKPHKPTPSPTHTSSGHSSTPPAAAAPHTAPSPSHTPTAAPTTSSPATSGGAAVTTDAGDASPVGDAAVDPTAGANRAALTIGVIGSVLIGAITVAIAYVRRNRKWA